MIADLFVHLGIATGSALYSISNNISCLISLDIYTKHFFYRYLAQAKLTVSLLKSFKYVVSKGKDFNYLLFSKKWSGTQNAMIYDLMRVGLLQRFVLWSTFCKPWIPETYIVNSEISPEASLWKAYIQRGLCMWKGLFLDGNVHVKIPCAFNWREFDFSSLGMFQ